MCALILYNDIGQALSRGHTLARPLYKAMVFPLEQLYFRGLWHGLADHDICAAITQYSSAFWQQHTIACADVIAANFDSWAVYVEVAAYVLVLYTCLQVLMRCIFSRVAALQNFTQQR